MEAQRVDPIAQRILACARCGQSPLTTEGLQLSCSRCDWRQEMHGHVVSALDGSVVASFDAKHDMVAEHNHHPVTWQLAYERQCQTIASVLTPGSVALDLGCGPEAVYDKAPGVYVVGVDASMPSVSVNADVDLGLHSTAARVPLGDATVDVVLANYVLHHMIGDTVSASWQNVEAAFAEIARVAKPGAEVVVLEICPWAPVWPVERLGWRWLRRALGSRVDFLFWPVQAFVGLGQRAFPGARFEEQRFRVHWSATFPPVIGTPWLKVPWFSYPFHVCLFHWKLAGERRS